MTSCDFSFRDLLEDADLEDQFQCLPKAFLPSIKSISSSLSSLSISKNYYSMKRNDRGILSTFPACSLTSSSRTTTAIRADLSNNSLGTCSPLHSALYSDISLEDVELFVELNPQGLKVQTSNDGNLPLHVSIIQGCSHEVISYIALSFPNAARVSNNEGCLPLHLALSSKTPTTCCTKTIELLLNLYPKGAQIKYQNKYPLDLCLENGWDLSSIQLLAQTFPTALYTPDLEAGDLPLLKYLKSETLEFEVVEWLASIDCCATLKIPNNAGQLPLHVAIIKKVSPAIIKLLLDLYPHACMYQDVNGDLPLHLALSHGPDFSVGSIQALLNTNFGACAIKNYKSNLPLHIATKLNLSMEVIDSLTKYTPQELLVDQERHGEDSLTDNLRLKNRSILFPQVDQPITPLQTLVLMGMLQKYKEKQNREKQQQSENYSQ